MRATLRATLGSCLLLALLGGCKQQPPSIDVDRTTPAPADLASSPVMAPTPGGPAIAALDPPQGATDVDPARTTLSVTFDRSMDPDGWAWVVERNETAPAIGESAWDAAVRVNTAQVQLAPGKTYVVWLNHPDHLYFRDRQGTPSAPVRWTFTTRPALPPDIQPVAAHRKGAQ